MTTLHVRCGSDIRDALRAAGIVGDFLEYADPICQGPTPAGLGDEAFRRTRASFLAEAYGDDADEALSRLTEADRALDDAGRYERVLLWFEHDIYDQSILVRLLSRLAPQPALHDRLFLIQIDRFDGIAQFRGLGQLTPSQLASLVGTEAEITVEQLNIASDIWAAYRAPDPAALAHLAGSAIPGLPYLGEALRRFVQEYPWTRDGLSLTERLALTALADGADTPGRAFATVMDADPQPYLGDLMFRPILDDLASGPTPFDDWRSPMRLTEAGHAVLAGDADWIVLRGGIDRWQGGVRLVGRDASWRWDADAGTLIGVSGP